MLSDARFEDLRGKNPQMTMQGFLAIRGTTRERRHHFKLIGFDLNLYSRTPAPNDLQWQSLAQVQMSFAAHKLLRWKLRSERLKFKNPLRDESLRLPHKSYHFPFGSPTIAGHPKSSVRPYAQMHVPLTGSPPDFDGVIFYLGELFHRFDYRFGMSQTSTQDLFFRLTPDFVMDAVEKSGWQTTGEYLQLNSFENRVFSVKTEASDLNQIIVKFYRPGRWSEAAIREEHEFLDELSQAGVAVVPPLRQKNGDTVSMQHGLWFAAFPKFRGRMPQELGFEDLTKLGRVLARLHNVGAQGSSRHRAVIDAENFGRPALRAIKPLMNRDIWARYEEAAEGILAFLDEELDPSKFQRIHGDAHRGNVLMTDEAGKPSEFFLVDFDDFAMGPVVQDFWMLFRHDEDDFGDELDAFLAGYEELREFDDHDCA